MTINDFIENLAQLSPSEDLMRSAGFDGVPFFIKKGFVLDRRDQEIDTVKTGLVFELFQKFDSQYLRFADFTFYEKIIQRNNGLVFAGSSYSELSFADEGSEVIEYDREEWSVLNYCALNTECFLIAMLVIFEMIANRYQNLINVDDEEINNLFLERCISAAGGRKYERFYREIIF